MTKFNIAMGVGRREPLSRIADLARQMEEHGFYSLWLQDNPLMTKDAYMALAVASLETTKLRLGPGVSNTIVRHPSVIANAIATLDQVSGGRAVLGLGGGGPALVETLGERSRRIDDLRKEILAIGRLLNGQPADPESEHSYRVASADRRVPIYLAARGPRMLALAGEVADGAWIAGASRPEIFDRKVGQVRAGAEKAGRDPDSIQINVLVNVAVDTADRKGVDVLKPSVIGSLIEGDPEGDIPAEYADVIKAVRENHDPAKHLAADDPVGDLIPEDLVKLLAIAGDESECRQRLHDLMELGPDEITMTLMSGGRVEKLESLARVALGSAGAAAGVGSNG
ncbi:MAG: LLM class flavin-dependent oxidoreductase [Dehalococcoidia bacterium]|nr:LLM class flavin-dependent oxidoreductase [Dehalococcoidia bacterium]